MHADFRQNHFELFGFAPAFLIDAGKLEAAYRELQARVHPDRYAQAADAERRLSLAWATRANEAYRTLKHPLERACYLLRLHAVEALMETGTAMPPDFLLRQMEWRETLGEARARCDIAQLERLDTELRAQTRALHAQLASKLDVERDHSGAAQIVRQLKFLEKLAGEIADARAALE